MDCIVSSVPRRKELDTAHLSRSFGRWLEDLRLHITRKIGVDRTNDQLRYFVPQSTGCLGQVLHCNFDFILTLYTGRNAESAKESAFQPQEKSRTVRNTRMSPFG